MRVVNKRKNMSEEVEFTEVETTEELNAIDQGQIIWEKYQKQISIGLGAIAILIVGYFGYKYVIVEPANQESIQKVWHAEASLMDEENFDAAINGDSTGAPGFAKVANEYSGYTGGKIAQYDLGISYLNKGEYQQAINTLTEVSFDDVAINATRLGAIGDAYFQLGQLSEANSYYEQAYRYSKNPLTSPIYMLKAGTVKEREGDLSGAQVIYQEMIEKYPDAPETQKAIKLIELVKAGQSVFSK